MNSLKECFPENNNKAVYDFLRQSSLSGFEIEPTNGSHDSFSFALAEGEDNKRCIERVFNITIPDGLKVDHRVRTIHSSALAALLCFCKVSKQNPITINGHKYDKVQLEWGNPCVKRGGQSKIDVALFNEDEKRVLLLEAKFSEYLKYSSIKLQPAYQQPYKETYSAVLPSGLVFDEQSLKLKSSNEKSHYCEGIKQMICHHIGAMNMITNEPRYRNFKISIGEVLFRFPNIDGSNLNAARENKFEDYCAIYKELASKINAMKNAKVYLIPEVLTYQEVLMSNKHLINERINELYRLF